MGYVQGMCDLLAPLMVILDDGEKSLGSLCFSPYNYEIDLLIDGLKKGLSAVITLITMSQIQSIVHGPSGQFMVRSTLHYGVKTHTKMHKRIC